jgi:alanyl-tRNA synthetase
MTVKLYWSDPLATTFETRGASLAAYDGKPSIVLAETLFYPEGGGQLGDAGTLSIGGARVGVADTQIDASGAIHHVLAAPPGAEIEAALREGAVVRGAIDEARRRDHMAQHTAQHALSRALVGEARADTVSARLGATTCTIDVSRPGIADADLHRVEDLVNALVTSDVEVTASFPTDLELAKLDLRKRPNAEKSANGVRVVTIRDFDVTPCGGTHVTRTGQIGQVRILSTEKYKGMLRISFCAGRRALVDARAKGDALAAAAAALTCGREDVPAAIAKLRAEMKAMRDRLDGARAELAELVAARVRASLPDGDGPHVVPLLRPNDDLASLRVLAGELTKDARVVALCGSSDPSTGELVVVVQRGAAGKLDCGAFMGAETRRRGGRGGGRPERAEGRFPKGTSLDDLAAAAAT